MKRIESLEAFYSDRGIAARSSLVNVFSNDDFCRTPLLYTRRDFYKIALLLGKSRLSWHHHEIEITKPALVFYNPQIAYSWIPLSDEQPGYFCLFKQELLHEAERNELLLQSPLFKADSNPVYFLNKKQERYVISLFQQMLTELSSDYVYKYSLVRNHLQLLIHEALKKKSNELIPQPKNAAQRITASFLELLERQFPIDTPERIIQLRSPAQFAKQMAVHVNHLNHAVKETTGKPTSVHIADRILAEAKALLLHSNWPVNNIAYSLGFEYPNYFYTFFKKRTGHSPKSIRESLVD